MKNEFIPYEQALALKELGFGEPCFGWFDTGYLRVGCFESEHVQGLGDLPAPLYQQAFRWFREKYNIDSWVQPFTSKNFYGDLYLPDESYSYIIFKDGLWVAEGVDFLEPEEAELTCLKKLIELSTQTK